MSPVLEQLEYQSSLAANEEYFQVIEFLKDTTGNEFKSEEQKELKRTKITFVSQDKIVE